MTSSRPYLIRAVYQWIVDNGLTPYLLVDARHEDVTVPEAYVENGRIVLNIAPMAVHGLTLGNDEIAFSARFSGQPMQVVVPPWRVLAIYARENGQGMMFEEDEAPPPSGGDGGGPEEGDGRKRPSLKVVK
ncbi:MAG: ClpXP protease specificity-enhancing factor [Gammaproteobacteria bacterium]|nr:MAG: ClpXP protease specificity-enhancing factor [Gammaproteobacteria bacterium]